MALSALPLYAVPVLTGLLARVARLAGMAPVPDRAAVPGN
jgi:hypothetical protein